MAHPVQHHLGDRRLADLGFAGGFIIDRLAQALDGARPVIAPRRQHKRRHGPDR